MTARLFIVAPGSLDVTAEQLLAYVQQIAGPGAHRLRLDDALLEDARAGREVTRAALVPRAELSETLRAFLRPGARDPLPVWLRVAPWLRQTGTQPQTLEGGTTLEVPVMERVGTLVDLLFRAGDVDLASLEAALLQTLEPDEVTRSDGTAAPAARAPVGLRLVPASAVLSPAVVFPTWQPPQVVMEPSPTPES